MAPGLMSKGGDESDRMTFDGNPVDLDRFLAHCSVILATEIADDASEGEKCSVLAKRLRGPALDWLSAQLDDTSANILGSLPDFRRRLKASFGVSGAQEQIRLRVQLDLLRLDGDLLVSLAALEGLLQSLGIHSDMSRLQVLLAKMDAPTRQAWANSGQAINTYGAMRSFMVNRYVSAGGQAPDVSRKRAKCGKCGRKGHTSGQCHSGN